MAATFTGTAEKLLTTMLDAGATEGEQLAALRALRKIGNKFSAAEPAGAHGFDTSAFTSGFNSSMTAQWLEACARCRVLEERLASAEREAEEYHSALCARMQADAAAERWAQDNRARWESDRVERAKPEILKLCEDGPIRLGADEIAKVISCQAHIVRKAIAKLISEGSLVASGTTRNRTYSRPAHNGRESFPSEPGETEKGKANSRPTNGRRKKAA